MIFIAVSFLFSKHPEMQVAISFARQKVLLLNKTYEYLLDCLPNRSKKATGI